MIIIKNKNYKHIEKWREKEAIFYLSRLLNVSELKIKEKFDNNQIIETEASFFYKEVDNGNN